LQAFDCKFFEWHDKIYPQRVVDIINTLRTSAWNNEVEKLQQENRTLKGRLDADGYIKKELEEACTYRNKLKISVTLNIVLILFLFYLLR
jgi:hypothetical protein